MTGYLHRKDGFADARLPEDDTKITFKHDFWIKWYERWQLMGLVNAFVHRLDMKSSFIYRFTLLVDLE